MKTSVSNLLSVVIICLIFCSKGISQNLDSLQVISTSATFINPLFIGVGLEGYFNFNNNLKDQTGKLANAIPINNAVRFSVDRKGNQLSSLYFDGTYSLKIPKVPTNTACSIALWIRDGNLAETLPIGPDAAGIQITKVNNTYRGFLISPNTNGMVISGLIAAGWHHVVVTYDGANFKMYIDGQLVQSNPCVGTLPSALVGYEIGRWWSGKRWQGYIDELRFYSRTLTAADVQSLYSL